MNKVNLGPASVVDEIISDAGTLQTLLDCIRKEISVSPIKRELMGTYADFYEGDVRRVEDLLSVSEKLLWEIKEYGEAVYSALLTAEKEESAA